MVLVCSFSPSCYCPSLGNARAGCVLFLIRYYGRERRISHKLQTLQHQDMSLDPFFDFFDGQATSALVSFVSSLQPHETKRHTITTTISIGVVLRTTPLPFFFIDTLSICCTHTHHIFSPFLSTTSTLTTLIP